MFQKFVVYLPQRNASKHFLMELSLFLIIPGLVCLFWALVHSLLVSRTASFKILVLLLFALFITASSDVLIDSITGSEAIAYIVVRMFAPVLCPLACLYFAFLHKTYSFKPSHLLWIVFPVLLATAAIILTSINGLEATDALLARIHNTRHPLRNFKPDGIDRLYFFWCLIVFRCIMAAEILYLFGYSIFLFFKLHFDLRHFHRFLFLGGKIRVLEIQVVVSVLITIILCFKLFLHGSILSGYFGWSICIAAALSLLFFMFGFFAVFGAKEFITRQDIVTAVRFNYSSDNSAQLAETVVTEMADHLTGESLTHVISHLSTQAVSDASRDAGAKNASPSLASTIFNTVSGSREVGSLGGRFRHLMLEEQLFLQPGLTLTDVAERLNTNKTYISKAVNQTYKLGFPEMLNVLRVDYAEQYIRKHPRATQEEIAKASGFLSASSFNSTFKRITGYTPKVWAASNRSSGK